MKHFESISKNPSMAAIWPTEHPDLKDSITGLLNDPLGTIELHFKNDQVV